MFKTFKPFNRLAQFKPFNETSGLKSFKRFKLEVCRSGLS